MWSRPGARGWGGGLGGADPLDSGDGEEESAKGQQELPQKKNEKEHQKVRRMKNGYF